MPALLKFACPHCHGPLAQPAQDALYCPRDNLHFQRSAGIWRFLLPERSDLFAKFIHDYETIRKGEGRGSQDPAYYRGLPYQDLTGQRASDWHIRAVSFDALMKKIIQPAGRALSILDLGAGNGWLSNRLASLGHSVAAVDLITNDLDGLGCYKYYKTDFTPIQAEFDRLPFLDSTVDLIIFNASLHYSINLLNTLQEALRVLTATGVVVVLDSPVYRDARSGEAMVKEREAQFKQRFGFPSNNLPSQNYLTYRNLQELESSLNIHWKIYTPFYGIEWLLRPIKAALRGKREPAKFHLITGRKI